MGKPCRGCLGLPRDASGRGPAGMRSKSAQPGPCTDCVGWGVVLARLSHACGPLTPAIIRSKDDYGLMMSCLWARRAAPR